ncbi:hypothetical protein C2E23DRAFT_940006 [Lenzites betulinus]|nr:hypothetical protein C2E23DRAFT_940006 [Lenzites betulinus]
MEYQTYVRLAGCDALYDSRTFAGVLPPTAIIDSPYGFSFVAMPRWSHWFAPSHLDSIDQVMEFIHGTLTGLAHLHRHRIVHRDISETNILVDWYCRYPTSDQCDQRAREHRRSANVAYALFDFDLSLILPLDTSLTACRRPPLESLSGSYLYRPFDLSLGERHYNPFAFDVACLGNLYLCWLNDAISAVPLLAPLFGKMTAHIVNDRWTAEEALLFFNEIQAGLTPEVLDSSILLNGDLACLDNPELYWRRLSLDLQIKWKTYRPPPITWWRKLLRKVNATDTGYWIVSHVRRLLEI